MELEPFRVQIAVAVLDDLRQRIAATRWPDEVEGVEWAYGANLAYLRELAAYWRDHFDWAAQERALNGFAHFRARIGGRRIHFIHARAAGDPDIRPLPLILTHGWPGTFFELLKLISRPAYPVLATAPIPLTPSTSSTTIWPMGDTRSVGRADDRPGLCALWRLRERFWRRGDDRSGLALP
jgi:hypothetical protein